MRFALLVVLCFGITVLCVQARKQCRANAATSTTNAATQLKAILAVAPAATTTVKPTVKPTVKVTPKPTVKAVAKAAAKPAVKPAAKPKPKVVAKPKAVAKPKPKPKPAAKKPACPKTYPPWYLTKEFNNRYRCVGLKNIPTHWNHPYDLSNVCRSKDKRAKPMSFHNGAQLEWCKRTVPACQGALTGMYVQPGLPLAPQNLRNHDGEKVDIPYTVGQPTGTAFQIVAPILYSVDFKKYTAPGKANVVCAFWL